MQRIRFTIILGSWHILTNCSFKAGAFIHSVNYKLALTKSITNAWTTRHLPSASTEIEPHAAVAVDLQQPEEVQGGVRRSVLQGIWWDRSLDSWMFLGRFLGRSQSLHLLISREALNPFMVTSDAHD